MQEMIADDRSLDAVDPLQVIRGGFARVAQRARAFQALPGGLADAIAQGCPPDQLQEALTVSGIITDAGTWALKQIGSSALKRFLKIMRPDKEKQPRKAWAAAEDSHGAFVENVDAILAQPEPIRILREFAAHRTEPESRFCNALVLNYEGYPEKSIDLLSELRTEWVIPPGHIEQYLALRLARAVGAAGDFREARRWLGRVIDVQAPVWWIQLQALRHLTHYQIQHAWTRNSDRNWRAVEDTLHRANDLLRNAPRHDRTERTRRSLLEMKAIIRFRRDPSVESAQRVEAEIEAFGRLEPTYGVIRTTPLAALFLRANAPERALECTRSNFEKLNSRLERAVSLLVQLQAHRRMGNMAEAYDAAKDARTLLSAHRPLLARAFLPQRFERAGSYYAALCNPEVDRANVFLHPLYSSRLWGPFIVDVPRLGVWPG